MNYCRSVAKRLSLIALYQFNPRITSLVYFFLFDRSQTEKKKEKWHCIVQCVVFFCDEESNYSEEENSCFLCKV